jgi:peptidoglycan/LPS O-acetylase OafA/YrhL
MKRIEFIDSLRGIAITGVIFTHVASFIGISGNFRAITDLGAYGVQLFFVVSGFTIFLTFNRSQMYESTPTKNFFIRRFCRIAPVYWAGIFVYSFVFGLESRGWVEGPELFHFPFFITFTNVFLAGATSSVVPGGWSISVEVMFYLTAPIWLTLIKNLRSAIVFTLFLTVISFLMLNVFREIYFDAVPHGDFWYRSPLSQFVCFGCGVILYFVMKNKESKDVKSPTLVEKFFSRIGIFIFPALGTFFHFIPTPIAYGYTALCLALLLSRNAIPFIVNRFTIFVGRVSFSAYILHFLVIRAFAEVLPTSNNDVITFFVLGLTSYAVTIFLSYYSWRYFEEYFARLGRDFIKKNLRD